MNKPQIRFEGYEDEWKEKKLFEVATYKNGKAHERDINEKGKFIVVNSKFISTDGKVKKYSNKQNEPLYKNEITFVLSDVPNGKAIAKTFIIDESDKYTLNQRIAGIMPKYDINTKYLAITMNRNKYFLRFDDGVKQINLSLEDMKEYRNYYPSISEQNKIGAIFSKLDNLITLQEQKYTKLKNIKKALLYKMFPKANETKPQIRFEGFKNEWKDRTFGEVFNYERPDKYIIKSDKYIENAKTPVLTANKAFILGYTDEQNTYQTERESILFDDFTLDTKFIDFPYMLNSSALKILTIKNRNDDKLKFNYELLKLTKFNILGHARHYISVVQPTKVLTTTVEEQNKIGTVFSKLANLIELENKKYEKLKNIKNALLSKMFI
ncbi:MAG: restriction endonuclease subunit S [Lachnospiraceae bacterium]|jgi:type I restriction enzyme S subunit|nr:restriction endonuclease subunit S [Lachnospiraceae bacterium]